MKRTQGFLLITVLLLCLILLTMGMAFLGSRARQYESAHQVGQAAQARALSYSGIEDARVKLDRDINFPPSMAMGQNTFTYGEDVLDSGGQRLGCYRVEVDLTYQGQPFYVIGIKSTGMAGPVEAPTSKHAYQAHLDVSPGSPRYYQFLRFEDLGSP